MKLRQFAKDVIEELGVDGMSSEDSCLEDGREFFLVRKVPHRRNVDYVLKMTDDNHDAMKRTSSRKGAKLVRRVRSDRAPDTRRPPFVGKSRDCYAPTWLQKQTKSVVEGLGMKKSTFKWIDLE